MNTTSDVSSVEQVPASSEYKYKITYDTFVKWQESRGFTSFDEDVVLEYFTESAKTYKASTLWCVYSKLKNTILRNNNIDISTYSRLIAFLKEKAVGFESKKVKIFSCEEINRFLLEAPDEHYLLMKVSCNCIVCSTIGPQNILLVY